MRWLWRSFALLSLVGGVTGYLWVDGTLPRSDGRVAVNGLAGAVEIVRDRHGVPHIFAQDEGDAYFALGYVHAQDRLWQMEINRRIGSGTLAELFGEVATGYDAFMRTLGLYRHAQRTLANLEPETRAVLGAYAAGVNAFLDGRRGSILPIYLRLPPEFLIFRHDPEPWRPADSLVWIKMMAWNLGGNWRNELLRARLLERLSAARVAEFLPPYPGDPALRLPDLGALYAGLPWAELPWERLLAAWPAPEPGNGSNNWVVGGARTVSGKPLLANDPHLGLSAPSVWYFAHLRAPGLDAIGATLPSIPALIVGRNQRIAWGATNTGPDVQDLYVERLDPSDPKRYLTPEGPRRFEVRDELIHVRGGEDVLIEARSTRHGPVLSDVSIKAGEFLEAAGWGEGEAVLAFAWTALRDDDLTAQAGRKLARARDWREFTAALRDYHGPQQSMVYADGDGNIGMYAPARVPVRKPENALKGLAPAPGWLAAYDWDGFIPFEELPHSFNPADGVIVTANQKIVPEDYPHHITSEWQAPHRARRIGALLAAEPRHSVASFKRLQGDRRSQLAAELLPLMLAPEPTSPAAAAARRRLRAWDGAMDRERPEPLIFATWYRELTRLIYADELGPAFAGAWGFRPIFIGNVLRDQRHWCDDVATAATESCGARIAQALERAVTELGQSYGQDMARWRWGEPHYAHSDHRPFSAVPVLSRLFDIKLPADGGGFTVNVGRYRMADERTPFAHVHGPGLRAIFDLADPERSLFMLSTGQSGNVFSPRYRDFAEPWRDVEYIPMITNRERVMDRALGALWLTPAAPEGAREAP
jgi:penicillin amidase